jgi:ATP-binding cassette ChvD family protein
MQFRPVGIESASQELPPEAADFTERPGTGVVSVCWGRENVCGEGGHDRSACFLTATSAALGCAFRGADRQLWTDLLKEGFNCPDRHRAWCPTRIDPVNGWKTALARLPFGGGAATSAAVNFRKNQRLQGIAMARQFVYFMQGLSKTYPPNRKVLDNVHLSFYPDAKIGVLGVNGSGKSTLLRIMAGLDKEYNGEAWVAEGARVGYLEQEPQLDAAKSVRENVMMGVAKQKAILDRYNELAMNYSDETADEMTGLQDQIESAGLWDLDSKVDQAMDALRCPPDDSDVTKLSGGERRRVALCKLLLDQPELLLLDEPTNHLDAESVSWLEGHLRNYPGAILIVTHDRYFLDNVTSWILELDRGKGIPYEGNYTAWLSQKQKRLAQEGREDAAHQRTLEREKEWIAASPKARQAKSKARYQRYEDLLKQAGEKQTQTAQITIPVAERLGQNVIDFEGLTKGFGDRLLIDNLTFKLPPGGIVGVIGPNGAGKTTLFRMITKQETPDKGTITVGESVHLGYVDQSRDSLDGKKNVWEEISGGNELILLGKREVNSRGYCSSFNFKGADQQKKVGALSGGERNRVHLAKMLKSGANVLLLDEPTNDLDVDTLRALEEALEDFAGCAVIISHDRWFLDRIATHILAFEGDSHVEWFEGNFQDYEKDKMRRLGQDSIIPHRMKYKKLTR